MSPRDKEQVDIDFPLFHVHVGGGRRGRVRIGLDDEEEVIDMEVNERDEYWTVRRKVRGRLRFLRHAFFFTAVNSVLFLLDWSTGGGFWVQWVALIWGAILAFEFVSVFVAPLLWGRDVEQRMIERELRRRRGA